MSSISSQLLDVGGYGSRRHGCQLDDADFYLPPHGSFEACWPCSGEQYPQPQVQPVLQARPAMFSPQLSTLAELISCSNDKDQLLGAAAICRAPPQQQAQQKMDRAGSRPTHCQMQQQRHQGQAVQFDRAALQLLEVAIMDDAAQDSMLHTVVAANTPEQLFCALDAYLGSAINQANSQQQQQQDQCSSLMPETAVSPTCPSSTHPTDCQLQLQLPHQPACNTGSKVIPAAVTAAANGSQNPNTLSPGITCGTRCASRGSGSTPGSTTAGSTCGTDCCMPPPQAMRTVQQQQEQHMLGLGRWDSSSTDSCCTAAAEAAAAMSLPMLSTPFSEVPAPSPMDFTLGTMSVPTGAFNRSSSNMTALEQALLLQGNFPAYLADTQQQQQQQEEEEDVFPLQRHWSALAAAAAVPGMLAGQLAGQQQQQSCGLKRWASEPAPLQQRQLQSSRKPRHSTRRLCKPQQQEQQQQQLESGVQTQQRLRKPRHHHQPEYGLRSQQQQPMRKRRTVATAAKSSSSSEAEAEAPPSPTTAAAAAASAMLRTVSVPLPSWPQTNSSGSVWQQQQLAEQQQRLRTAQSSVLSMSMQFMHYVD